MNFRGLLVLVGVVAFIILPNLVEFLIEWLWFGASGYRDVYVTSLRAQASLGTFILGFAFLMLYGNLWVAVSSIASPYIIIGTGGAGHRAASDDPARADPQAGRHRLAGRVADDQPGRQQRMDALAPVPERRAVRRRRSDPGA